MTDQSISEQIFIAKNMDANYHASSAGGVATPNGNYFGSMVQAGGEGLSASIGGKLGAAIEGVSIDNTFGGSREGLDKVLGSFKGDVLSANPFSAVERIAPVQNIGSVGTALSQTGKGLAGVAEIKSFSGAINAGIEGHSSLASPSKGGGGMQQG